MQKSNSMRFPAALILALFLAIGFLCGAQAQQNDIGDGYSVVARYDDGPFAAAVVADPETGGLTLLTAVSQNGVLTVTGKAEHAIPADWAKRGIGISMYGDGQTPETSAMWVTAAADTPDADNSLLLLLEEDGWKLTQMRGELEGVPYFVSHMTDGGWSAYGNGETALLTEAAIDAALPSVDFDGVLATAAAAIADKITYQNAVFQERWQAAYGDTAWADAAILARAFRYTDGEIVSVLAAAQTDDATGVCVFQNTGGAWEVVMNDTLLPPDTSADDFALRFEDAYGEPVKTPEFTVATLSGEAGAPDAAFEYLEQDGWRMTYLRFQESETEYWHATFRGDEAKLYAGHYIGEEGYLHGRTEPSVTRFSTFDFKLAQNATYQIYDDFMAGEAPLIPDDGSAFALPQPCGAKLRSGKYAVYTGPGTQYARETDGKAAVSGNDWVQVFGTDGGWALVQYRIDGPLLRFGYVEISALESPDAVPALQWESASLTDTENEFVTSNPLGLGGRLQLPHSGCDMTRLCTLGDYWMYVELILPGGKPARMFAEINASHG